jgi:hypothetical protein
MSVSCGCCVLSGRGFCVELITRPEESYECGVSECDREASIMRRGCYAMEKKLSPDGKAGNQEPNSTFCRGYTCIHAACFNTPCTHRPRAWYIDTGICIIRYNLQTVCIMNAAICIWHVLFYRKRQLRTNIKAEGSVLVPVRFITAKFDRSRSSVVEEVIETSKCIARYEILREVVL